MAELYTAPEYPDVILRRDVLFMAGGITGCPQWQNKLYEKIKDIPDLIVYNPRRDNFDIDNEKMASQQVEWEYFRMKESNVISFWFPDCEGSVCPITLYELGKYVNSNKEIFVGVDPDYERKFDVQEQLHHSSYHKGVYFSLDELANRIKEYLMEG